MSVALQGQFDPQFTAYMTQTMALYRQVFRTANHWTLLIDGTARAGIEACLASTLAPGDKLLVPIFGRFGHLKVEIGRRLGADVASIETEWGRVFETDAIEAAILQHRPRMIAISHGDTSTTMLQPLAEIGALCRQHDVLLYVDCTASLGGNPFEMDAWQIDVASAGLQKCLSGPPGSSPITFNDRVAEVVNGRKHVEQGLKAPGMVEGNGPIIRSNYFDLAMLMDYWSPKRLNHHTEAASMLYAARECARVVLEEGLENGLRPPPPRQRRAAGGPRGHGPRAVRRSRAPHGQRDGRDHPEGDPRRREGAPRDAGRLRHRDRHLVRAAGRQDLAHRHHGLRLPQGQRAALPDRARGGAAPQRPRSCRPAPRSMRPARSMTAQVHKPIGVRGMTGESKAAADKRPASLLEAAPRVINVGLERFAEDLAAQNVAVQHVQWSPPAGGDARLAELLSKLGS